MSRGKRNRRATRAGYRQRLRQRGRKAQRSRGIHPCRNQERGEDRDHAKNPARKLRYRHLDIVASRRRSERPPLVRSSLVGTHPPVNL